MSFISSVAIEPVLRAPSSMFQYVFSYQISVEMKAAVARKLGFSGEHAVLLTPSGTAANLLALNLVKLLGKKRLVVALPVYFQVPIVAHDIGLQVRSVAAARGPNGWNIPAIKELDPKTDAIWITHPIHGFGESLSVESIAELGSFAELNGSVVADECFCQNGMELGRSLGHLPGFVGTYSPHKSVCMNGVKLGVIIANSVHLENLEQRSDVWAGPLTRLAITDAEHFLSDNYNELAGALHKQLRKAEARVESICARFGCNVVGTHGLYRAAYVRSVSPDLEQSPTFVREVIMKSGSSFIPLYLNYGPPGMPFGFRVNLARQSVRFDAALTRLLEAL